MQNQYDLKRYAVLYVDDEEKALKYFEKSFGGEFRILTASSAAEGIKLIEQHGEEIGVLLSDQRMPGEKGVQLLERARQLRPRLVRMMVTAYADFGVTVDAVNLGSIFRYISKPIQVEDMRNTLHRAMEFYILQQERDDLLREKLSVLQNMLITDRVLGLGIVAAGLHQHLRNPLRAVHAFLELTPGRFGRQNLDLDKLRDASFWREFHGLVVKQSARIAALLGSLQGSPTTQNSDVAALLQGVADEQRPSFAGKGVELRLETSGSLPAVATDEARLRQMIQLLLQSELSRLAAGSSVTLTVKTVAEGADSDSVLLCLVDNGPALSTAALGSVFDPFHINTEAVDAAGLHLMGVYFLVHHLGGRITSPRSGTGLTFNIILPSVAPTSTSATDDSREFISNVLMNDTLWERLLPDG